MKKQISLMLLVVLLFQTIASSLWVPSQVTAEGDSSSIFNELIVKDRVNNELDISTTTETEGNLEISWSVNGLDVKEGYTETIEVPSGVHVEKEESGSLTVDEKDLGTYVASTDGVVTVIFNELIEDYPEANGVFNIAVVIDDSDQEQQAKNEQSESEVNTDGATNQETQGSSISIDDTVSLNKETNQTPSDEKTEVKTNDGATNTQSNAPDAKDQTTAEKNYDDQGGMNQTSAIQSFSTASEIQENIIKSVELQRLFEDGTNQTIDPGEEIVVENPYDDYIVQLDYQFALPNGHSYGDGSTYTIQVPDVFNIPIVSESSPENLLRQDGTVFGTFYTNGNEIIITFNDKIETESDIMGSITLESSFDADYDGPAQPDDITFPIEGEGSVSFPIKFIPKGSAIDKQGVPNKKYNTETITWTVDFNKNLQEITNATLTDEIVEGAHQFVEGSLKVYQLEMNADGTVNQEQLTDVTDQYEATFPLALGNITNTYRVVYDTEVTDNVGQSYKNKATLSGNDFTSLETEASVSVNRGDPLDKNAIDYDDVEQTITWQVKFNYDEKSISQSDARLSDVFGDNLTFVAGSVTMEEVDIDPDTGEEVATREVSNYQINETSVGLDVQFDDDIDKAYKITYQTTATDRVSDNAQVTNTISDEFEHQVTGKQGITQGLFIKSHRNQGTDYNAKETNWRLVINRDQYTMENIVVTDTLPLGFTTDEVLITHGGQAWNEGDQYTFTFDEATQKITILFNQTITDRVEINYTTLINFDEVETSASQFTNNATLEWNIPGDSTTLSKEGQATFTPDNYTINNGFKNGTYNYETKEITWRVGVNYNNASLTNVIVEDFIQGNQNFTIDNLKVYEMTLTGDANGYEKGAEVTGNGGVSITEVTNAQSEPGFQVGFGDINKPYLIEYTTDLTDELIEKTYNNTAAIETDNRDDLSLDATVSIDHGGEYTNKDAAQNTNNARVVNWDVRINYTQSTVENLTLTDTPSINQTLLRDTFKLYGTEVTPLGITKDEENMLEEGTDYTITFTENEEGQESFTIDFKDSPIERSYFLEYDTYILYAGDEIIVNDMKFNATGTDSVDTDDTFTREIDFSRISGTIRGEVGSLQVNKMNFDDPDETLEGAVFELYDETGEVLLKTVTTDTNGVASFNNLLYADYVLKEAKAPEGYVVGINDKKTVTIDQPTTEETISNKPIKRHVRLIKNDGTDGTTLPNVMFELRNTSDDTIYDTYETDSNGEILVEDLPAGDYYFVETSPATDYQANDQMYNFTIEEKQTEVDELIVENELISGQALITKVDADNNSGLAGAEFEIHKESSTGEVVKNVTTEQDGVVNTGDLRPGNYVLVETKAPKGYQISQSAQNGIGFEIVRSQQAVFELNDISNEVKTTSIELTKTDSISRQTLVNAEYELTYVSGNYDLDPDSMQGTTNANGKVTFDNLKPGTYQLTETKAPDGYILDTKPIEVDVTFDDVDVSRTVSVDATNDPYAEVTLEKQDAETGYQLARARFNVIDDDTKAPIDGFTDLETDENGALRITGLPEGTYQLEEVAAPTGYTIQGDGRTNSFELTAGTTTEQITIGIFENEIITGAVELTKVDGDTIQPLEGVEFELQAITLDNGGTYETTTHTSDGNGTITVTDLRPGTYRFVEVSPLLGYQPYWKDLEFTIELGSDTTETVIAENYKLVDVSVEKQWNDVNDLEDQRPTEIKVDLYRSDDPNTPLQTATLNGGDWLHAFTDLKAVDTDGNKYDYWVAEQNIENYQLEGSIQGDMASGYTITNVLTTAIDVEKIWLDSGDDLGYRPDQATVQLLRDGNPVETVNVNKPDNWQYTFSDLPVYNAEGELFQYEVTELNTDANYRLKEVTGNSTVGFSITNVRSEQTTVEGTKTWLDDNAPDGPESITVNLMQNGTSVDSQEVTESTNWQYSFTDLEQYNENGVAYEYTVDEEPIAGYDSIVDGYDITNVRSEEITIEGTKTWLDDNTPDRPESITVNLMQNGTIVNSQEVTESTNWQYSFSNLEQYNENGVAYEYTVEEETVVGYESTVGGYDITNLRVGMIAVEGTKTWLDNNAPDRPESITVNLMQNGTIVDSQEVTESTNWQYSFTDLEQYNENGVAYEYKVEEEPVTGYEPTVDGYDITNVRFEDIIIEGTKTWNDDDISDRPTEITVYLLQNGQHFKEATITAANDWQYIFTDLPKYDEEGVLYTYTVEEVEVEGYTTTINGFDITNTRSEQTDIVVQKTWLDDDASDRPTKIHVDLLRNGEPFDEVDITANENWTHIFEDLEAYDEDGQSIIYTVEEAPLSGYQTTIDGYDITNLRVGTTSVEGSKTWKDDDPSDRPEAITVNLLQNGIVVDTQEVTEAMDWQYSFTDLEQYDEEGKAYTYTVKEQGVPGYQSETAGYDLINTRAEKTAVAVTKTWLDNQTSDRPTSITVTLLGNGEPVDKVDITADQDWSYTFEDLEAYDVEGQPITYTIEEAAMEGYQSTIDGYDITNLRIGTTSVEGSKTWKDDDPSDRPEAITVNLLQNGIVVDTQEVTEAMNWQYSFTDLEQYDEKGITYRYSIEEEKVVGYQTTVEGYNLINTFVPSTSSKDKTNSSNSDLPSTATDMFNFILFGMLLWLSGLVAYWLAARRTRKE